MPDDKFSEATAIVLKEVAAGAAEVIDEALDQVVLGPLFGVAGTYLDALAEHNNKALAAFRLNAVEDEIIKLRAEFDKLKAKLAGEGKTPDRHDPLTQAAVVSEFVKGVSEAKTTAKREALVHATCAQFDPRRGSAATRDYWLRRLRELPDEVIKVLLLLDEYHELIFVAKAVAHVTPGANEHISELTLVPADRVAYQRTIEGMQQSAQTSRLVVPTGSRSFRIGEQNHNNTGYRLGEDGEILVSFCKD